MFGLGSTEMILILVVILFFFGAKKLPELARSIGRSLGEFSRAKDDFEKEVKNAVEDGEKKSPASNKDSSKTS